MDSETSSIPRGKPSECPSEIWDTLGEIIEQNDKENIEPCQEVFFELYDVNLHGEVALVGTDRTNLISCQIVDDSSPARNPYFILENCGKASMVESDVKQNAEVIDEIENSGGMSQVRITEAFEQIEGVEDISEAVEQNVQTTERISGHSAAGNGDDPEKNLTRKRRRDPSSWKQNIRKLKRQKGEDYLDTKGQPKPSRRVRNKACRTKQCPLKCTKVINDKERQHIHSRFWRLSDEGKTHFYSKYITRINAVRKRTKQETSRKKYSYEYHFDVAGVMIKVCQEYFLNTLDVSKNRIYYFFKKNPSGGVPSPLTQGKHQKKVIEPEKKDDVRSHISSFSAVESHYCRAQSSKKYLERGLSLRKMYDLYRSSRENPVKFIIYSQIFNTELNIAFVKPKKDLCDKCELFKVLANPTPDEIKKQDDHIQQKNLGKQERDRDRSRFVEDKEVGVVMFDLQNTFSLPKANVSNFYYKTKLCCYNLTAHLDKTKVVYNAIWHEFTAGRAAIHIASGMFRILREIMKDNPNLKHLILWSDSCVPQNKNSIMSFALQYFLHSEYSKNLEKIEQKFSEAGHGNVQEIDNAHSCIERHLRNVEIWSPLSLVRHLLSIPSTWKLKFKILQMRPADYSNFQKNSKTLNYNLVPYTRVKQIIYTKQSINTLEYKEHFEGVSNKVKIQTLQTASRRSKKTCASYDFATDVPLAELEIKVSELKRKHLTGMIPYMPNEADKCFYNTLLGIKNTSQNIKAETKKNKNSETLHKKALSDEKQNEEKKSKSIIDNSGEEVEKNEAKVKVTKNATKQNKEKKSKAIKKVANQAKGKVTRNDIKGNKEERSKALKKASNEAKVIVTKSDTKEKNKKKTTKKRKPKKSNKCSQG